MTVADKVKFGLVSTKELVFVQGLSNIIEKNLGENEIIQIRPENIIAFSSQVQLKRSFSNEF